MTSAKFLSAIGLLAAAASAPGMAAEPATTEPTASANGKYCLRVEASTGSKVETVQCMSREQWAAQGVDVDKEWATDGVVLQG